MCMTNMFIHLVVTSNLMRKYVLNIKMEYVDIDVIRTKNQFAIPVKHTMSSDVALLIHSMNFAIVDAEGNYYDSCDETCVKYTCQICNKSLKGPYWMSIYDAKTFCNACHLHANIDLRLVSLTEKIKNSEFYARTIGNSLMDWEIVEQCASEYKLVCSNPDSQLYLQHAYLFSKNNAFVFSRGSSISVMMYN